CPEVPALRQNPVFAYMMDRFTRPAPFQPDVAVAVDAAMDVKWKMLDAMTSQVYEWLPWLQGETAPQQHAERLVWLQRQWDQFFLAPAQQAQTALHRYYGDAAARVRYAELFEICE